MIFRARRLALPIVLSSVVLVHCEAGSDVGTKLNTCTTNDDANDPYNNPPKSTGPTGTFDKINQFVVIFLENRSFDNLYGSFDGAENLSSTGYSTDSTKDAFTNKQVDAAGSPYATLPQPGPDARFPANLPNEPFDITKYIPATVATPDLVHRWYQEQLQIDGGKMDRYAVISDAKGLVMGYYPTAQLPMAKEASDYTLCDHFFHAAFGGSFLNHQWLIAARSPVFPNAPASVTAQLASGTTSFDFNTPSKLLVDGFVMPDGCYDVNTSYTVNSPHPASAAASQLLPNQTHATIGDRLTGKGLDWAWYSGGWNDALAGNTAADNKNQFQFHHQPFAYFANYADGTQAKKDHLKDEQDFLADVAAGHMKAVSFIKPVGLDNEHPGYSVLLDGEAHVVSLIDAIRSGPQWKDTAIIVTYDEHGGQWDHVAPPKTDKWGPGTRVPAIIISPYAKKHYVDKTPYDTTAILATIEHRWGLDPLTQRDANMTDLAASFDFTQTP